VSAIENQTIAYQFTTPSFDGSTLAPNTDVRDEEDQFYLAEQDAAGLFPINDPSEQGATTGRGNRWLTWIELRLDGPAPAGSKIEVVDNSSVDGSPVVLKEIADYAGEAFIYLEEGYLVPQGAVLRVTGGAGILRYHVTFLEPQGLALLAALTLAAGSGGEDGACCLDFSDAIADAAGTFALEVGIQQRYDATGLAPNAMVLQLPPAPVKDQVSGIIEVGDSTATIQVDGNGHNVATFSSPGAPMVSTGIARQSLIWQYDGVDTWRAI